MIKPTLYTALALGVLFLLGGPTRAFAPKTVEKTSASRNHRASFESIISSGNGNSSTALPVIRRRAAFSRLKKALLAGVGMSTASKFGKAAEAEDLEPGKIVTFQVDNLNGEPGSTGVFKVQLQPSWAPRGVERFEVCT